MIVLHYENALPGRVASLVARFESRSENGGAGVRQTGEVIHTIFLVVWHRVAVERGLEETRGGRQKERKKERAREREGKELFPESKERDGERETGAK